MGRLMSSIIGHRGAAGLAPENTLAGIDKAVELGIGWVELDVTLLGDGLPVMFHDSRLHRTTNGKGYINKVSGREAGLLDAGGWFSDEYAGEKIPGLFETLELIKQSNLGLNLELKPNGCDIQQLSEKVIDIISQTSFPREKLLVSSFNYDILELYQAQSDHQLGCLFERLPRNWKVLAENVGAVSIHLNANKITEKKVVQIKDAGYEIYCYTVNDPDKALVLKDWGVDGVFSDYPQQLTGIFKRL